MNKFPHNPYKIDTVYSFIFIYIQMKDSWQCIGIVESDASQNSN